MGRTFILKMEKVLFLRPNSKIEQWMIDCTEQPIELTRELSLPFLSLWKRALWSVGKRLVRNIPTVCQHFFIWSNGYPPFNFSLFLWSTTNNWPVKIKLKKKTTNKYFPFLLKIKMTIQLVFVWLEYCRWIVFSTVQICWWSWIRTIKNTIQRQTTMSAFSLFENVRIRSWV